MSAAASIAIPPLVEGERLTRAEFERRYDAMPDLKKAELLEGVVYMGSPVKFAQHGRPHSRIVGWLSYYQWSTPGTDLADNGTLRLSDDNEPQPDAMLFVLPKAGGQARIADDYVEGAIELVVEIAASSKTIDLGLKKRIYQSFGIQEYLVWSVREQRISWFILRDGQYIEQTADGAGRLRGVVFPGLWLDVSAMIADDQKKVRDTLDEGLGSSEHAAFVAELNRRVARPSS